MGGTYSMSYTPITGDTITAARWITANAEHIAGNDFTGLGDYSADATEMQSTTDPYPAGAESLATNGKGELERLRYQLKTQFGLSQWYHDVTVAYETFITNIASYRRPRLVYVSATQLDVENNTGTSNQTKILFPDGTSRSVTEDTSSTHKYRRFDITADAEFTSGTEDSGLRAALSEATNTWYAIYAVKSAIDTTKFVLVGDTTLPVQGSFATLNTAYGTNGWVYLGMIINGDNGGATGDILSFVQWGGRTLLINTLSTSYGVKTSDIHGVSYKFVTGTPGSTTYTYAAGTTAGTQIPSHLPMLRWNLGLADSVNLSTIKNAAATRMYMFFQPDGEGWVGELEMAASEGVQVANGTSAELHIALVGWYDGALSFGTNPVL